MQGVIRTYDPDTGEGVVVRDTDRAEIVLAADALEGSIFRMLRQGQRVVFELDPQDRAIRVRIGRGYPTEVGSDTSAPEDRVAAIRRPRRRRACPAASGRIRFWRRGRRLSRPW